MENLKDKLIDTAKAKGICTDGYGIMLNRDIDGLVEYYLENPDWCMERQFPDLHTLKEQFSDCEDKGIYINKTFKGEILNDKQVYVFHNCRGTIKTGLNLKKRIIPMIYICNGCRLRIVGTGDVKPGKEDERSIVPIYIFGDNDLSAKDNKYVKFNKYEKNIL